MQIDIMEPNMLLSIINMKLRDQYKDLSDLCDDLDLDTCLIEEKLKKIGYVYSDKHNQFITR
ncbi:MAG: hypothetical protein K0Q49_1329 [Haloplasmataceae bacterium]|jgi:hypothetical protein|nr:hypothetical protein [Haloplasmataceae bacterium]